jgi:uncharacterized protein (DUF924 family)
MIQPTPLPAPAPPAEAAAILDFWLDDALALDWPSRNLSQRWFGGGAALDDEIKARFGQAAGRAVQGGFQEWETALLSRLALVLLLDQFTRNVFRGTGLAFAGDARAQRLTLQTLANRQDLLLPRAARVFMYMPLMHAEDAALQAKSVACFSQLAADAPEALTATLQGNLDFARQHQAIIDRFGRFPYRNAALGRPSTPEETDFLRTGPRFGQ